MLPAYSMFFAYEKYSLWVAVAGCDPAEPFMLHMSFISFLFYKFFQEWHPIFSPCHHEPGLSNTVDNEQHFNFCLNQMQIGR